VRNTERMLARELGREADREEISRNWRSPCQDRRNPADEDAGAVPDEKVGKDKTPPISDYLVDGPIDHPEDELIKTRAGGHPHGAAQPERPGADGHHQSLRAGGGRVFTLRRSARSSASRANVSARSKPGEEAPAQADRAPAAPENLAARGPGCARRLRPRAPVRIRSKESMSH